MTKTAVVLFNLGGPDRLSAVKPFLFNLFSDPSILPLPNPFRFLLAKMISARREKEAREIYKKMGGSSPLLKNTQAQADALQKALGEGFSVHIAMRYWHPRAEDVWQRILREQPEQILLLPLYPQYSTTTTGSSLKEWIEKRPPEATSIPLKSICCYPQLAGFVETMATLVRPHLPEDLSCHRVLFAAHGLPRKIVETGDPYVSHVEKTAKATLTFLNRPDLDSMICYQSRVGPLKWTEPAIDQEILRGAQDRKHLIVVPISFVSEHSETLVELDLQYQNLALQEGALSYTRIQTVSAHERFINGLVQVVRTFSDRPEAGLFSENSCPPSCLQCPRPHPLFLQKDSCDARLAE